MCIRDRPGTRDYRYFAALFLFIRMLFYIVFQATLTASFCGLAGLTSAIYTALFVMAQPYKHTYSKYNTVTTMMFILMTAIMIALLNANIAMVKDHQLVTITTIFIAILVALPQFYAIAISINWIRKQDALRKFISQKHNSDNPTLQRSSSASSLLAASENRMQNYQSLACQH